MCGQQALPRSRRGRCGKGCTGSRKGAVGVDADVRLRAERGSSSTAGKGHDAGHRGNIGHRATWRSREPLLVVVIHAVVKLVGNPLERLLPQPLVHVVSLLVRLQSGRPGGSGGGRMVRGGGSRWCMPRPCLPGCRAQRQGGWRDLVEVERGGAGTHVACAGSAAIEPGSCSGGQSGSSGGGTSRAATNTAENAVVPGRC